MTDSHQPPADDTAATTPVGITTICPECGASLDTLTTSCGRCGAAVTNGGPDGDRAERVRQRLQVQVGASYQLGGLIGRGGMGIVFKARELALDREVALKVLAFDPALHPEAYTRFEREARLAARLDHPNIVPIFAVGQGEGVAFYTMRYVRGGSLETLATTPGGLPLDHAVRLLRDVASALDFAHGLGVVHRDIKPANILMSDSGHAMVADFGIARAFGGDSATSTSESQTGTGVVGSPAYMAPEQWRGEKPDGRADQYALGVLAFELLAGRRPFAEVTMQELLRMHLGEDPPTLNSVRQGLPPNVSLAIQRAMAKAPADRFPSALAFVDALSGHGAVGAMPPTKKRVPTVTRRERTLQWVGNTSAAVLVLTAAAVGWSAWRKSRDVPPPAVSAAPMAADTLTDRLTRELGETRQIALDAQRRAERAETRQGEDAAARAAAPPAAAPDGHLSVTVRGGNPRLFIDEKEAAVSTPAILSVPPGRHVVRVAQEGRQYVPPQFVIDVAAGDTSRLQFSDARLPRGGQLPGQQPGQQPGQPRFNRNGAGPLSLDSASVNPYLISARTWAQMSPQEQGTIRARWDRLTPDQKRSAMREIMGRDSAAAPALPRKPRR
ncbi:MAG: protein kinase [Gemmatimonadetes bacterium]|nr:protein kinase [Gemmatimonadota bacterium]